MSKYLTRPEPENATHGCFDELKVVTEVAPSFSVLTSTRLHLHWKSLNQFFLYRRRSQMKEGMMQRELLGLAFVAVFVASVPAFAGPTVTVGNSGPVQVSGTVTVTNTVPVSIPAPVSISDIRSEVGIAPARTEPLFSQAIPLRYLQPLPPTQMYAKCRLDVDNIGGRPTEVYIYTSEAGDNLAFVDKCALDPVVNPGIPVTTTSHSFLLDVPGTHLTLYSTDSIVNVELACRR
jgi:hypothetical protein